MFFSAGGVCVLRVSWGAVPLAPPQPGAGTAAMQRGAALGRHGDPAVPVAAEEDPATPQVHQDRSAVSPKYMDDAGRQLGGVGGGGVIAARKAETRNFKQVLNFSK